MHFGHSTVAYHCSLEVYCTLRNRNVDVVPQL